MFYKPTKSRELQILDILQKRSVLTYDQKKQYRRLLQGYQGEMYFASLLQNQSNKTYPSFFDLQLEVDGSECQIDCLLLSRKNIYLLEIKNYLGDYYIEHNKWYSLASRKEIKNPLHQLNRSELIFREFLHKHAFSIPLKSFIVFVHPEFQLYQAPLDSPIIFPSQLNRFIQKCQSLVDLSPANQQLMDQLTKSHQRHSAYEQKHVYDYHQLRKGIICGHCNSFMKRKTRGYFICNDCKTIEKSDDAFLRNIHDFYILFPKKKITVSIIEDWWNYSLSKDTIRRALNRHLDLFANGKFSYYIPK